MRRLQRGQSMVEFMLTLPLILILSLGVVQLIWIAWWQLNLGYAVAFSVRAGTLAGGSQQVLERTLVAAMAAAGFPAVSSRETQPSEANLRAALISANLQQWQQFKRFGRLQVISPTVAQQQRYQQWLDTKQQAVLPIDHAKVRYQQAADPDAWLAARQLKVAVTWCLPLRVPLIGGWLVGFSRASGSARTFCQLRAALSNAPLWPLERTLTAPMQSDFVVR